MKKDMEVTKICTGYNVYFRNKEIFDKEIVKIKLNYDVVRVSQDKDGSINAEVLFPMPF